MGLLEGKTAIITGASKGIGRAIAEKYVAQGANVAFTYLSSVERGEALEKELSSGSIKVKGYRSDASDYAAAEKLVEDVIAEFGQIDIVVNNAGITKDNLLMRMTEEMWDDVLRINLKSCFNVTKAATKVMMRARKGSVINITSVVGIKGNAGQSNYSASKAGMIGFTKSVALELGSRNIRCNAVAPGFIESDMTAALDQAMVDGWKKAIPMKRGGQPEEVANVCVFLGSDMSSYVSGQTLNVCGAMLT